MAYSAYRGPTSPREDQSYPVYPSNPLSPPRNSNRLSGGGMISSNAAADHRGGLQRRFTTNALPTLSPIGQQRLQAVGDVKQQSNRYSAVPPSEQKSRFYESLLAEQRRIQAYIEQIDPETRREVDQNLRHEHAVSQMIAQSEPTTPPDFGDAFPTSFSKPNRYSANSLNSANTFPTRPNRASTQLTSPPMALSRLYNTNTNLPSQSVPGSRRQSDDEEEDEFAENYEMNIQRTMTNPNRNSLPVLTSKSITTSPQDNKTFLQVQHTADGFPKLIRREDSTSLADQPMSTELDRPMTGRNRISLPPTALRTNDANIAGLGGILNGADKANMNRRSIEARPSLKTTPPRNLTNGAIASYSTNDVPTLKSINGTFTSPPLRTSDIATNHSKTPSLSRTTSGPFSAAPSQDLSSYSSADESDMYSPQSHLQANAPSFGPLSGVAEGNGNGVSPYAQQQYYGGYGMQMLTNNFGNMGFNAIQQMQNQYPYNGYLNGQANGGAPRNGGRRAHEEAATERLNPSSIEGMKGNVFNLCTDQHGCRFLQRKLDEGDVATTNIIFEEVRPNIIVLMIDPFGNYLCQKLLERCTDSQRTQLIKGTTKKMADIALNQHGTRALQKMIEYIKTPEQTNLIIEALRDKVVQLIQDLNGNHVIQKCLTHLPAADAQFIFDSVGIACVAVGTHRHGCCVLQRCIDHAAGTQKSELVRQITNHAMTLIQDPFGNYVIQYILDIGEPAFTKPLCMAFLGQITHLSTQKFSSNVIEKCIRCADKETKDLLIMEMTPPNKLEIMLRDGFANYVVQTAIDYASDDVKNTLIDSIRPLLPSVRHLPHGRRIQSKINDYDGRVPYPPTMAEQLNGGITTTSPTGILTHYNAYGPPNGARNRMGFVGAPPAFSLNTQNGTTAPGMNGSFSPMTMNGYSDLSMNTPRNQANYQFF